MFRKIITRLAYSPAVAEELTVYARQLRNEEARRQIGLVFVVLALIIQSFAILFPPESANAGGTTSFIEGGVSTIDDYLRYYDQDTHNIKDLFSSLGISRADIESTHLGTIDSSSDLLFWKMSSTGDSNDIAYDFLKHDGSPKTAYHQSVASTDLSAHHTTSNAAPQAYLGYSSTAGWFALLKDSGNLLTKPSSSGDCMPESTAAGSVAAPVLLSDIKQCNLAIVPTLSARNLSNDTTSSPQVAHASDRIMYTLSATNNEEQTVSLPLSISLGDLLEYAQLIDKGGASFNQENKTLTWAAISLAPHSSLTRSFVIKLLPVIPSTAIGTQNSSSYDCTISSSFGKTVRIPVACPFSKSVERITRELPVMAAWPNLIFATIVICASLYLYARSRQLHTELRLIRHNYHGNL